jgi:protein TonB
VLEGNGGTSQHIVYLAREGLAALASASNAQEQEKLLLPRTKKRQPHKTESTEELKASTDRTTEASMQSPRAGSPFGSLSSGSATGEEVRPALPIAFADPAVFPWQLPAGVHGDVVVEITIDTQGNIAAMKVLQTIGHGVEDKVLAALRKWHFRPATRDGVPIASEQDVHFHFPS